MITLLVEKLKGAIKEELNSKYQKLCNIVSQQETLKQFAGYLRQAEMIGSAGTSTPKYDDIIKSCNATLDVLDTTEKIEAHCRKFISALQEIRGTGANECANQLEEGWISIAEKCVAEKCDINFILDVQGKIKVAVS